MSLEKAVLKEHATTWCLTCIVKLEVHCGVQYEASPQRKCDTASDAMAYATYRGLRI